MTTPFEINNTKNAYKATVAEQVTGGSSGQVPLPPGTAPLPGVTFTTDSNTGLFLAAANTVGISTDGAERVRVTSTGSVGVGTTPAATALLDVQSTALGIKFPVMTTAQRDLIPDTAGLVVFITDVTGPGLSSNDGTGWAAAV